MTFRSKGEYINQLTHPGPLSKNSPMYYQQLRLHMDTRPVTSRTMSYLHLYLSASLQLLMDFVKELVSNFGHMLTKKCKT